VIRNEREYREAITEMEKLLKDHNATDAAHSDRLTTLTRQIFRYEKLQYTSNPINHIMLRHKV